MIFNDLMDLAKELHAMGEMALMGSQDLSDMDLAIRSLGESIGLNVAVKRVLTLLEKYKAVPLSLDGPGDVSPSPGPDISIGKVDFTCRLGYGPNPPK